MTLVTTQRRTDAKKLKNSRSAESSQRARVSRHPAPKRRKKTHRLRNQAIGHASVAIQRRTDAKKLTVCRIKPSGTRQSPSSAEPARRNSRSAESSHRARVSRHPAPNRREETHSLPNQAIGHASVDIQRRTNAKKLTVCRIKPSGTRQSPSSAEPTRRNSPSAESSHRACVSRHLAPNRREETYRLPNQAIGHASVASSAVPTRTNSPSAESSHRGRVSRHPAPNRREETHRLPNQTIGHASVAIQRRTDAKKLTVYRIKPSGTRQSPSSAEPTRRNSLSAESSHRARVSRHPAPNRREETHSLPNQAIGHASVAIQRRTDAKKLTVYRIKPSGTRQSPSSAEPTRRNSLSAESSHRARVSRDAAPNRREETHSLPYQAIGHASVAVQRRTDAKKLTLCRIKPSGTRKSPSSAEPTRRNSPSTESSHRAGVSHHLAPNRREETHSLPNQAIGHASVAI